MNIEERLLYGLLVQGHTLTATWDIGDYIAGFIKDWIIPSELMRQLKLNRHIMRCPENVTRWEITEKGRKYYSAKYGTHEKDGKIFVEKY